MAHFIKPSPLFSVLSASLFVAILLVAPRRAVSDPVIITNADFHLTFPNGWMTVPGMPTMDSGFMVIDTGMGDAAATAHGTRYDNSASLPVMINAYTMLYTGHMARTDSSTKVLGGNSFSTVGYADTSADGDSTSRVRIYVTTKGSYLFVAWLIYKTGEGTGSIAGLEAALATLSITATSGIRSAEVRMTTSLPAARYDAQGRIRTHFASRVVPVPLFQKP